MRSRNLFLLLILSLLLVGLFNQPKVQAAYSSAILPQGLQQATADTVIGGTTGVRIFPKNSGSASDFVTLLADGDQVVYLYRVDPASDTVDRTFGPFYLRSGVPRTIGGSNWRWHYLDFTTFAGSECIVSPVE